MVVDLLRARGSIILLASVLTGVSTLVIGPLSFVGLMAPSIARMLGLRRPASEVLGVALVGALIMVTADWLGRNLLFPYQVPAGLFAALVGTPCFLLFMRRLRA